MAEYLEPLNEYVRASNDPRIHDVYRYMLREHEILSSAMEVLAEQRSHPAPLWNITAKNIFGKVFTLKVRGDDTFNILKLVLSQMGEGRIDLMRIICPGGKQYPDTTTLTAAGLGPDSELHIVMILRGD